jgi:outer membrane protein
MTNDKKIFRMKRVRNKRQAILFALFALPVMTIAQTPDTARIIRKHEFSIQQAVDYARKNNVTVKNALLDVQVQEQTNREVTSAAYPQVSASGSITYNAKLPVSLVPAEFFGGQPGEFAKIAFGTKWNSTAGIELNQLLFDGQVFVGLQARAATMEFAKKNVEVTEEMIKANIYKIYYQLVVSKRQIELLDANISRFEKLLHDTREIYKAGFAEQLDVDKVSVGLTNLQTEKIRAENQVKNGYLGLKVLMGMPVQDELVLTDELKDSDIKEGILDASDFKYENRKEIQYADIGVRLNEYNIKRYKLSKIPTVSLNGYYNVNAQRDRFDLPGGTWFDISAFTLRVQVPIFNGFATKARIQKAQIELQKTLNQREALKLSIDNEIETSRTNFLSAVAALDYQKKNMELAEKIYQQTKKKYEMGTGSQTEINTAQTDLKAAQTNYITALYEAIIARVDFLTATGKL